MNYLQRVAPVMAAVGLWALGTFSAAAQTATPIKFQLDWRFEGPAALFLTPAAKDGQYVDAVVIDSMGADLVAKPL